MPARLISLRGALNQMGCDLAAAQTRVKALEEALGYAVGEMMHFAILDDCVRKSRAALYPRPPGFAGGRDPQSDVL